MSALRFGHTVLSSDSMPSTQDAARMLVEREGPFVAGNVYITAHQTAGRGRQGRVWYAPPGANLNWTAIGCPVAVDALWQMSFVAGVAVVDMLALLIPDADVRLRFPNDVLLGGKKVAGILVETATGPNVLAGTAMPLIGVGINVQGSTDALPPEVAVRATTIEAAAGVIHPVATVGGYLARTMTTCWNEWRGEDGFRKILAAWKDSHDPDARRLFLLDGESLLCRVTNVSETGETLLELPDGSQRTVFTPQIVLG